VPYLPQSCLPEECGSDDGDGDGDGDEETEAAGPNRIPLQPCDLDLAPLGEPEGAPKMRSSPCSPTLDVWGPFVSCAGSHYASPPYVASRIILF